MIVDLDMYVPLIFANALAAKQVIMSICHAPALFNGSIIRFFIILNISSSLINIFSAVWKLMKFIVYVIIFWRRHKFNHSWWKIKIFNLALQCLLKRPIKLNYKNRKFVTNNVIMLINTPSSMLPLPQWLLHLITHVSFQLPGERASLQIFWFVEMRRKRGLNSGSTCISGRSRIWLAGGGGGQGGGQILNIKLYISINNDPLTLVRHCTNVMLKNSRLYNLHSRAYCGLNNFVHHVIKSWEILLEYHIQLMRFSMLLRNNLKIL